MSIGQSMWVSAVWGQRTKARYFATSQTRKAYMKNEIKFFHARQISEVIAGAFNLEIDNKAMTWTAGCVSITSQIIQNLMSTYRSAK